MKRKRRFDIKYCVNCNEMTNHILADRRYPYDKCLKCNMRVELEGEKVIKPVPQKKITKIVSLTEIEGDVKKGDWL